MLNFHVTGTPAEIMARLEMMDSGGRMREALRVARARVTQSKREIRTYEAAALYYLAHRRGQYGGSILEIGTAYGYSCAVMAEAAPLASITTLNPKEREHREAVKHLAAYPRVKALCVKSWDYLAQNKGWTYDLVFIDGDHGKAALDFAWFERLKPGGLLLLHDYAADGSGRPCQPVYEAANALRDGLGRDFDVRIQADDGVGLVGFYRRGGEMLPSLDVGALLWDFVPGEGWVR